MTSRNPEQVTCKLLISEEKRAEFRRRLLDLRDQANQDKHWFVRRLKDIIGTYKNRSDRNKQTMDRIQAEMEREKHNAG